MNGALILAAGLYQLINPPAETTIAPYNLHANVWWGAVLFVVGLIYTVPRPAAAARAHNDSEIGNLCQPRK